MKTLTEDEVKSFLQCHLRRGLVVVIGSGLSCAEGLPSMTELADYLNAIDVTAEDFDQDTWISVLSEIKKKGIEGALHFVKLDDDIADFIRTKTAQCIIDREELAVKEVMLGSRKLKLTKLLPHLPQDGRLQIVTPNYDRLIELAAELAGFKVDTKAFGLYHAQFSATSGSFAYCDKIESHGRLIRKVEQKVISLYKPHGSLDWLMVNGVPVRSGFYVGADRCLVITPGQNKYRAGYDQPFDLQRELANRAIESAQRLLIIGYGFNDDHLETHLCAKITAGTPTVIMTKTLTPNAQKLIRGTANLMAVECASSDPSSTNIYFSDMSLTIKNQSLWDIDGFVKGVM